MSSHGTRGASPGCARLPDAVPFTLPAASQFSWELGSRVTSEDDVTVLQQWDHPSGRRLTVYDATEHTVVLGIRTPAGRERFYGATKGDLDSRLSRLEAADDWRRSEE